MRGGHKGNENSNKSRTKQVGEPQGKPPNGSSKQQGSKNIKKMKRGVKEAEAGRGTLESHLAMIAIRNPTDSNVGSDGTRIKVCESKKRCQK